MRQRHPVAPSRTTRGNRRIQRSVSTRLRSRAATPDLLHGRVDTLVVGELDHVAVGIGERADVADRWRHLRGWPRQASLRLASLGDVIDLGAAGDLDTYMGEGRHRRLRALGLVADEADEHQDEWLFDLIAMTQPGPISVCILPAVEQLERCEPL